MFNESMGTTLYIMVGLPGSGKSYLANKLREEMLSSQKELKVLSSDQYRKDMFGDENDQTHNAEVFSALYADMRKCLISGIDVVIDATNINLKARKRILSELRGAKENVAKIITWVIAPPVEVCRKQNASRERVVEDYVIDKFLTSFQFPQKFEGFDEVWINDFREKELPEFSRSESLAISEKMRAFDQKNPHHIYTVGEHCDRVFELIYDKYCKWSPMAFAGSIHDIGKLFTQKLDEDGVAHYYNHDSIGTYYLASHLELLVGSCWDDIFEELFFVNYHMRAHRDFKSPKAERKYRGIFGGDLFNNLMFFGECDRRASGTYKI